MGARALAACHGDTACKGNEAEELQPAWDSCRDPTVTVSADRLRLSWTGPSVAEGLRVASRDMLDSPAITVQRVSTDSGLLGLLLQGGVACILLFERMQATQGTQRFAALRVSTPRGCCAESRYFGCAGRSAKVAVEGMSVDALLDDAGEFRILQLVPPPPDRPGAARQDFLLCSRGSV